ncbi:MAG: hypothetical protein ACI8P0_005032, partial [Planctomycetaceae bacterium]
MRNRLESLILNIVCRASGRLFQRATDSSATFKDRESTQFDSRQEEREAMNEEHPIEINRRDLLRNAAAVTLASAVTSAGPGADAVAQERVAETQAPRTASDPTLIRRENKKQGSRDWQLTRVRLDKRGGLRCPPVEGYCSKQSVSAGESIDIMVSTDPPQKFSIEIFRTGYYGGRGARLMTKLGPFNGTAQPLPEVGEKRIRECKWEPSTTLTIPDDWPSGVYLGRLTTESDSSGFGYWQNYVVFIVRDDRPADILLQCSDNTWQAYNQWPDGYSVYTHPKGNQGPWADVSFDRPYGKYSQIFENPQTIGSGEWLCFEFPMAYWLEKHGYDVTYCSNSDMLTPERGLRCKAFISIGH